MRMYDLRFMILMIIQFSKCLLTNCSPNILLTGTKNQTDPGIQFTVDNGTIKASFGADRPVKGTYAYTFTPVLADVAGNAVDGKPVKVSVTVADALPKVTAAVKGTLNPVDRTTQTAVKLTTTNLADQADTVTLTQYTDLFTGSVDENGNIIIKATASQDLKNQTYVIPMTVHFKNTGYLASINARVTVKETLPAITVIPSSYQIYNLYSFNKTIGTVSLSLGKVNGEIAGIESMYNSTLQKAYSYTFSGTDNTVTLKINDSARIRAGSTAILKFKVTYKNQAANTKAFGIFTVRIVDRSLSGRGVILK